MKALIQKLKHRFQPAATLPEARLIAQICGVALKDVGLNVPGSVFQLNNSNNQTGWLINLSMPSGFSLPSVEVLTLRLFLVKRICQELKLPPESVRLIVSFNVESKRLPFPETMVNEDWLRSRIALFMVKGAVPATSSTPTTSMQWAANQPQVNQHQVAPPSAHAMVSDSTDLSNSAMTVPASMSARVINPLQPPINSTLIYLPDAPVVSRPQQKSSRQILDELANEADEIQDEEFAVFDGSLSDFQRAFN